MSEELPGHDPGGLGGRWPTERSPGRPAPTTAPASKALPIATTLAAVRSTASEAAAAKPPPPVALAPVRFPRPATSQSQAVPAARMLHSASRALGGRPAGAIVLARQPFHANPALRVAQLAILAQSALGIMTAVRLIRGTISLANVASGVTMSTSAALTANYAKGIAAVSGALILGVITVSLPSQTVRALLAVFETVLLGVTLAAHFGGGSVLGFITVLTIGASGSAIIPFAGIVALQCVAIYVLSMHPPTYRAYAR